MAYRHTAFQLFTYYTAISLSFIRGYYASAYADALADDTDYFAHAILSTACQLIPMPFHYCSILLPRARSRRRLRFCFRRWLSRPPPQVIMPVPRPPPCKDSRAASIAFMRRAFLQARERRSFSFLAGKRFRCLKLSRRFLFIIDAGLFIADD